MSNVQMFYMNTAYKVAILNHSESYISSRNILKSLNDFLGKNKFFNFYG